MNRVLKLRIALCLALIVGTLTLTNGMLQGARVATIIYRIIISVTLFGFIGYGLGFIFENYFKKYLVEKEIGKGQEIDLVSEQPSLEELSKEPAFSPFTADNFQQMTRPKE
jgi:hypothetical protein